MEQNEKIRVGQLIVETEVLTNNEKIKLLKRLKEGEELQEISARGAIIGYGAFIASIIAGEIAIAIHNYRKFQEDRMMNDSYKCASLYKGKAHWVASGPRTGNLYSKCVQEARIKSILSQIKDMKSAFPKCKSSKKPEMCEKSLKVVLNGLEKRLAAHKKHLAKVEAKLKEQASKKKG